VQITGISMFSTDSYILTLSPLVMDQYLKPAVASSDALTIGKEFLVKGHMQQSG